MLRPASPSQQQTLAQSQHQNLSSQLSANLVLRNTSTPKVSPDATTVNRASPESRLVPDSSMKLGGTHNTTTHHSDNNNNKITIPIVNGGGSGATPQVPVVGHTQQSLLSASNHIGSQSVSQRRKKPGGGTTMTLYVKPGMGGSAAPEATLERREASGGVSQGPEEGTDAKEQPALSQSGSMVLMQNAMTTITNTTETITDALPAVQKNLRQPLITAAIIFVFFLLCNAFMLVQSKDTIQQVLEARTIQNDELLSMTASISATYLDKLSCSVSPGTPLEEAEQCARDAQQLKHLKARSIKKLYKELGYLSFEDDIAFLVEQHVAYEAHIKDLVIAEMEWLSVSEKAARRLRESRSNHINIIGGLADSYLDDVSDRADRLSSSQTVQVPYNFDSFFKQKLFDIFQTDNSSHAGSSDSSRADDFAVTGVFAEHTMGAFSDSHAPVLESLTDSSSTPGNKKKMYTRVRGGGISVSVGEEEAPSLLQRALENRAVLFVIIAALLYAYLHLPL